MKNFIVLIVLAAGLTSCTKEYTCECSKGFFSSATEDITIQARDEGNAENICIDKGNALAGKQCHLKQ